MSDILHMPNHVASPPECQRLTELGVATETQLMWIGQPGLWSLAQRNARRWGPQWLKGTKRVELWPAYTVAELMELVIDSEQKEPKEWIIIARHDGNYVAWIDTELGGEPSADQGPQSAPILANALAGLIITRAARASLLSGAN